MSSALSMSRHHEQPRVIVCQCLEAVDRAALTALQAEGFELVPCLHGGALLEEVVRNRPDVVVYALQSDQAQDLGVLKLLRRVAPSVPLVIMATDNSLETRSLLQTFRPIYFAVCPVDPAELLDAVRSAITRSAHPKG